MPGFELIETLLWQAGTGAPRLALHRARLERSAATLGFACDWAAVERKMRAAAEASGAERLRLRLTLARDGAVSATAVPCAPEPPDAVWRLRISECRLDQSDPLLRHKTSRRALYDGERERLLAGLGAEEVLFLNRAGRVADGGITCPYVADPQRPGLLRVPPLADGCLDSVLRAELLAAGRAVEAPLGLGALRTAPALFVGNAVRGLIPARLLG